MLQVDFEIKRVSKDKCWDKDTVIAEMEVVATEPFAPVVPMGAVKLFITDLRYAEGFMTVGSKLRVFFDEVPEYEKITATVKENHNG